ncbi:gamma-glutamyltranspeptidase [Vibrio inusitatus NBRC 102082]|uniref:Glutathione hydrolase proenzyme n=1 Tax=Vibrio inusitatus NBRC 102082 TaxID=1219070 RepID=A0A4Y3HWF2_9VIBR|nr:gamma-glutamyltransferase [Vibrio inusitatus]GEA51397.1 gamma-glutamyltranspeptidase [Vibrio inusitatus NBRC 102082]
MQRRILFLLSTLSTTALAIPYPLPTAPDAIGDQFMVSATNQYVTSTGYSILKQGGNAVDAMVAMQMVMSVVEPDMTGIGGGTFALYYNKAKDSFIAYDGRDTAPSSATPDMFLNEDGKAIPRNDILGPRSVAIPGTLKLLYSTHQEHGKLEWAELLEPAIDYAQNGYAMNSYTYDILVREQSRLESDPEINALYWAGDDVKPTGSMMTNPELANTLKLIAKHGDSYMYNGPLGEHIVETVNARLDDDQYKLSMKDFNNYQMVERDIVQSTYRGHDIVSFGYPASGGVLVAQTLEMLEPYKINEMHYTDAEPWRLMTEAMRLAKEDRITYAGDPSYVDAPVEKLLDKNYLAERGKLLPKQGSMNQNELKPGTISQKNLANIDGFESQDTGHISIVDAEGNAIAMTSTVGTGMGSGVMVDGVLLNAQMANFSSVPEIEGKAVQNSIMAGKRPRSAITPLMVMEPSGGLKLVVGSPGSSQIPGYVLKTVVGMIDWDLSAQSAIDLPNIQYGTKIDRTKPYNPTGLLVEKRTYAEILVPEFTEMGYEVHVIPVVSGLNAVEINNGKLYGATDRRRASTSLGD